MTTSDLPALISGGPHGLPSIETSVGPTVRPLQAVLLSTRTPPGLRPSPMREPDGILVLLAVAGGSTVSTDGPERCLAPGEIVMIDPSRPYRIAHPDATCAFGRSSRVTVPSPPPSAGDVHGMIVAREDGAVLASVLLALVRHGADLTPAMAAAASAAAGALLGALVDTRRAHRRTTKRDEILAFIDAEAADADLTPDGIAGRMGVSRTVLYRMLEPLGGVTAHVQRQRLRRMRDALTRWDDDRTVETIAYASGFRSAAHANRSFRKTFGMAPGAYRRAGRAGTASRGGRAP